jgi:hypothetical protein
MLRFDLARDAEELSPQPVSAEEERRVQGLVDQYLGSGEAGTSAASPALSPGLEDRLRKLGYVN